MGNYRLSLQAEADLLAIYETTDGKFGSYQADAYHAGLEQSFGLLSDSPCRGTSAEELRPRLRRLRFQSHNIFYSEEAGYILICGLIDVRMNIPPDLVD